MWGTKSKHNHDWNVIIFFVSNCPPNIIKIEIVFPIPGHSFLPPDRIFGRIEKILKNQPTITDPETYLNIFKDHGTVNILGTDCPVMDWKSSVAEFFKPVGAWHFKFSLAKRFILTKNTNGNVSVCGELYYNSNTGIAKPILKKGKRLEHFSPQRIPIGVPVKPAKLADVRKLLVKHFGEEWHQREDLLFFKTLLSEVSQVVVPEDIIEEEEFCEIRSPEEDSDLRI